MRIRVLKSKMEGDAENLGVSLWFHTHRQYRYRTTNKREEGLRTEGLEERGFKTPAMEDSRRA